MLNRIKHTINRKVPQIEGLATALMRALECTGEYTQLRIQNSVDSITADAIECRCDWGSFYLAPHSIKHRFIVAAKLSRIFKTHPIFLSSNCRVHSIRSTATGTKIFLHLASAKGSQQWGGFAVSVDAILPPIFSKAAALMKVRVKLSLTLASDGDTESFVPTVCRDGTPLFKGRLRRYQNGIQFLIGEEDMKETGIRIPLRVNLGTIELALEELLSLRPGDALSFAVQPQFAGALYLGETPLAQVEVKVGAEEMLLEVTKIEEDLPSSGNIPQQLSINLVNT